MLRKKLRIFIYLADGVIQDVLTPDDDDDFEIIVKDIDGDTELSHVVYRPPVDYMSEKDWEKIDELVAAPEYEPEEDEDE
jgi:hypothetical protein